jgi:hypothetical protein
MKRVILLTFCISFVLSFSGNIFNLLLAENKPDTLSWLNQYNIIWTTPGNRSVNSMPIGGGNVALNVWTTEDELLFYIGSPDSWVDGDMPGKVANVKLNRVRVKISPNPFSVKLRQELELVTNSIRVSGEAKDGTKVNLLIWVDAFKPIVHIEGEASGPVNATVQVETWRGEGRFDGNSILWSYRNEGPSRARSASITRQGIQNIEQSVPDPIGNLTFGGRLSGAGMVADSQTTGENEGQKFRGWRLKTKAAIRKFDLQATLRIAQDPDKEAWEQAVSDLEAATLKNTGQDWERTKGWWKGFWNRSHILINPGRSDSDPAWQVGRNYNLFRAMLGSNSSGRMPTLFNGGAFLCDADPDRRQWGEAGFTAQNQRLVYWPLLKSGDADLLDVALDFYAGRLPLERAWAKHFWDVNGAVFPEDIDVFGMTVRLARKDGTCTPECLQYHWTSGMEFALMMLETWRYYRSDIQSYIPVAGSILHFYDQFYRKQNMKNNGSELDPAGHLVIYPGNGLEVYSGARNDAAALSGLMALSDALLALPEGMIDAGERNFYREFRSHLAPLPTRMWRDHLCISPAESWAAERFDSNMELPQLYPVFPFQIYGVGQPDLELARDTWKFGYTDLAKQKAYFCWYQGGIFAACLGLTDDAREYALAKFLHPFWPSPGGNDINLELRAKSLWKLHWMDTTGWEIPRYPAFWDCMDFDQRPDMDHGGSAMIQLQEMLMHTTGDQIILFPAWPKEWDVDFKLHAPENTTVECVLKSGEITTLKVTPESRRKDIVIYSNKKPEIR